MRRLLPPLAALILLAPPAASGFSPGATSLGDPLFPQIGNGGYDARHYDVDLRYDPVTNRLEAGTRTLMVARASKGLSSFSLDFQRELTVTGVAVNGAPAGFEGRDAAPRLGRNPKVTQPAKLIVTPPAGIPAESRFTVEIAYEGEPRPLVDPDLSSEGWIRACSRPGDCDGSFTVNEPLGAQSWLPCNNHPSDKATVDTTITAPASHVALGAGELAARTENPDGTATWAWVEGERVPTYLLSATVGRFDLAETSAAGRPVYGAIDSAGPAVAKEGVRRSARALPGMLRFFAGRLGPYPFGSAGYVADWVPSVGYALENVTKPHFSGTRRGPAMPRGLLAHEVAHQWRGDSVTPSDWSDIWFSEGWATLGEALWTGDGAAPRLLRAVLRSDERSFRLAPAELRNPKDLFDSFTVYSRPGAMLEGYRQIVGQRRFRGLAHDLSGAFAYGSIDERAFLRRAVARSGFGGRRRARLRAYFEQWLHWNERPRLTPADFR